MDGKRHDNLVTALAHDCRLESFEPSNDRGESWKATFFIPQGPASDGSNRTLTQEQLDHFQKSRVENKLDHFRGQPYSSPKSAQFNDSQPASSEPNPAEIRQ
jgi:hypothetical protein